MQFFADIIGLVFLYPTALIGIGTVVIIGIIYFLNEVTKQ